MTTHYIEQLGLKKCREILSGAPEWSVTFNTYLGAYGSKGILCKGDILFTDLRHELSLHDTDDFTHLANHIGPLTIVEENLQEQFQMMEEEVRGEYE